MHNIIICKNNIFTNDSYFYVPNRTIHRQTKYVTMDYFNQEAKKFRHLINLTKSYWQVAYGMAPCFHPLL